MVQKSIDKKIVNKHPLKTAPIGAVSRINNMSFFNFFAV